jgi:hypothetical protein
MLRAFVSVGCIAAGALFIWDSRKASLDRARLRFAKYYAETRHFPNKLFEVTQTPLIMGIVYKLVGTALIVLGISILIGLANTG